MALAPTTAAQAVTDQPRIDLRLLVVDDGGEATGAIRAELDSAGTPYTRVDLNAAGRPTIDAAFLSDTVNGEDRAKFQAVVLPNDNPFGAGSAEMTALAGYEAEFGIRQIDAYTYSQPAVGLNWAQDPGYIGSLDGIAAEVTTAGKSNAFGYLKGSVPFEDNDPTVSESYGYLATPLAGAAFTPLVDAPIPGTSARGSLVGQYDHDGRSELVVSFVYNEYQQQFRLLARGMVEWATQGIHLGQDRNYFSVTVDDLFLADDRWSTTLKCTPGDVTCPPGSNTDSNPIRMSVADEQYAKQWTADHDFPITFAYNGGGSEDYKAENGGSDPLAQQFIADQTSFGWINHTMNHEFLGCVQNVTVVPWQCTLNASGNPVWTSQSVITSQISDNLTWAATNGLTVDGSVLVTGEHSGLVTTPQQPADNPYLAPALTATGVKWLASDASRETQQRALGSALTVPRHPMNIFYNAGTAEEEVDEYNWIYTSSAQGGSGSCEGSAISTCLPAPLNTSTGYQDYIVPLEARIDLGHVLKNDLDPHFIHQSNLAEDRIAYPVLEKILGDYADLFDANTPVVSPTQKEAGIEMQRRAAWAAAVAADQVTAYRVGGAITVSAPTGVEVPFTAPAETVQLLRSGSTAFGTAYAGQLSGWTLPGQRQTSVTLVLDPDATPAGQPSSEAVVAAKVAKATAAAKTAPAARSLPVPSGVSTPVPVGPADQDRVTAGKGHAGSGKAHGATAKAKPAKGHAQAKASKASKASKAKPAQGHGAAQHRTVKR
ncbi:hypothetical protein ACIQGZ_27695 [Streptomyces sp. NPDC092296]|uniref:hypothetical protein n=1 Tax=Streptomyces sp. NPDC092296 TaxID=3366012 RepID=UPI00382FBE72